MKPMGVGQGVKLTTGETIGRWSLDMLDGKRVEVVEPDVAPPPLEASSLQVAPDAQAADDFAERMMANVMHRRAKLTQSQTEPTVASTAPAPQVPRRNDTSEVPERRDRSREREHSRRERNQRTLSAHATVLQGFAVVASWRLSLTI